MIKLKKVIGYIGLFLTIAIFIIALFSFFNYGFFKGQLEKGLIYYGLFGVLFFAFILDLFPQNFSAHAVIVLAALLGMNMFNVVLVTIVGVFFASIVGFWLGRVVEEDLFKDIVGKKIYKKIEESMDKWGKWYVMVSSVTPLPYIPIVFGALNMKWREFIIYGVLPRFVGLIVMGIAVHFAADLLANWFQLNY